MSTPKSPLENKENTQSRPARTKRDAGTTININTSRTNGSRQSQDETEQYKNSTTLNTSSSNEETQNEIGPEPIVYSETQFVKSYSPREARIASPLAATLFARFDPNDPREQPAEHAIFIDSRLAERGYI